MSVFGRTIVTLGPQENSPTQLTHWAPGLLSRKHASSSSHNAAIPATSIVRTVKGQTRPPHRNFNKVGSPFILPMREDLLQSFGQAVKC
mmetsp:Transcript_27523/g.53898  ORF Transcript_27523/g.53898 Transcript_27523/m.53898 type:complete len:89 (-) Transcript_27523:42-308(-)